MRLLAAHESSQAAEVLARAFYNDPLWLYLLPADSRRAAIIRQAFCAFVPASIRSGQMYGVGDPLQAVAIWSFPGQRGIDPAALINLMAVTLLFNPAILAFRRALPIFTRFAEMQRRYAPEPHYYLNTIGVAPEAQGSGRASQLIKPVLAQADDRSCSVYTETMTLSNVGLYEHYGFRCVEAYAVPRTNLHIWAFLRPARRSL
jgi:GNAT superfamily N-acetyltransferase